MIQDLRNMHANGSDIEDEVVCLLFLRALPEEYSISRKMLEREQEKLTIDRLRTELRYQYDLQTAPFLLLNRGRKQQTG